MKKKNNASEQQPVRPVSGQDEAAEMARDKAFGEPELVASATECTGLSPAAVRSEEEAEHYAQMYGVHVQLPARAKHAASGAGEQRAK